MRNKPIIYVTGSLRNPQIPVIGNRLRTAGFEVFDDWFAAGEIADTAWREYELGRGHSYTEALDGYAAKHVFEYDREHLAGADAGLLVMPAGKSSFMELGILIGSGRPGYILLEKDSERWDVMVQFATLATDDFEDIVIQLGKEFF